MPFKERDFLLINYTLTVKESNTTVETTLEGVAKDAKIFRGEERYEPLFVVVGEGWVPKGLEEAFAKLELGKKELVEVTPEKGYGARDPKKVRLVPLRRFSAEGLNPSPGMQVTLDGKLVQVRAVGAGRVQVDYNHPLAGKTLLYEVTVEKLIETDEGKIRSLIHRHLSHVDQGKFNIQIQDDSFEIEIPEEAFFLEGLQLAKRTLTADLEKFFPKARRITFLENFKKTTAPAAAPAQAVTPEPSEKAIETRSTLEQQVEG